jgi:hypothetical protein
MTDQLPDIEQTSYDPGSMPTSSLLSVKAVWYKRPWFLLTVALVLIVAVSVVTDLPHHVSRAEDTSAQNATITQINGYIAPCVYAVSEAFTYYNRNARGQISPANLALVPNRLEEDQVACSFASGPINNLTNLVQPTGTPAGKQVDKAFRVLVTWLTSDANGAIVDIAALFKRPGDAAALAKLSSREAALAAERQTVLSDLGRAGSLLHTTLTPMKLPALPHLIGS